MQYEKLRPTAIEIDLARQNFVANHIRFGFVSWLKLTDDNKLIEYIYALNNRQRGEHKNDCCLALVRTADSCYINGRLWFHKMAGYKYAFDGQIGYYGYEESKFYHQDRNDYFIPWSYHMNNYESVIKTYNDKLKYIPLESAISIYGCKDLFKCIQNAEKYPYAMEMLIKTGNTLLIKNSRWLKLTKKQFLAKKDYLDYARKANLNPSNSGLVNFNIKNKIAPENAIDSWHFKEMKSQMKKCELTTFKEYFYLEEYLRSQGTSEWEYNEYFRNIKELGYDLNDHYTRYPRDFHQAYDNADEAVEIAEFEREKKENALFEKKQRIITEYLDKFLQAEKMAQLFEPKEDYYLSKPMTFHDFVQAGNTLHNCVGRNGYFKKERMGDCLIFIVMKSSKPYACLEIEKSSKKRPEISQLYTDHNGYADKETEDYVKTNLLPLLKNYFVKMPSVVA